MASKKPKIIGVLFWIAAILGAVILLLRRSRNKKIEAFTEANKELYKQGTEKAKINVARPDVLRSDQYGATRDKVEEIKAKKKDQSEAMQKKIAELNKMYGGN